MVLIHKLKVDYFKSMDWIAAGSSPRGMGAVTSSAIWQIPPWYGGRDFVHDWKVLPWYGGRDLVGDSAPKMPCPAGKSEGKSAGIC